jgi:TPR repeat protein
MITTLMVLWLLPSDAACDGGDAKACMALGAQVEKKDLQKAVDYYVKACDLKLDKGCTATRALRQKGCDQNDGPLCNDLGSAWSEGKYGTTGVDHVKAKAFYEKACKLGNGIGCFNLGNVYRVGEGMKPDPEAAKTWFAKSCDMDTAKGCTELAIMLYEAHDAGKALELMEKACKLGSDVACKNAQAIRGAK